jgi:hypothetical protein
MKDSFNADFYITAATVAPLLYITLFLQSQVTQNSFKIVATSAFLSAEWFTNKLEDRGIDMPWSYYRLFYMILAYTLLGIGIIAILVVAFTGMVAEALSLWALYYRSDNATMGAIVLWSMLVLIALVCAFPIVAILGFFRSSSEGEQQEVEAKTSSKTTESSTELDGPPDQSTTKSAGDNT